MSAQLMTAFLLFSISISLTPGAGNIALLGISSRYGFGATLPFVLGNALGATIVLAGSSIGLVSLFTVYPELYTILKTVGAAYLLYLAWMIATSDIQTDADVQKAGFVPGVIVQIVNPKSWVASLTVFSQFITADQSYVVQVSIIITVMVFFGVLGMLLWAYFGAVLKKFLNTEKRMLWVNRGLGGMLAAVALFMVSQST
ncbi:LysE family translocator [Vibrio paucivorans]